MTEEEQTRFAQRLVRYGIGKDGEPQGVSGREAAVMRYARKLTLTPGKMCKSDIESMRSDGLDDGEILDANQAASYFAYVNRVVDGLGVELEGYRTPFDDGQES